jgi:cytochrome c biogenesis protein ResB
MFSLAPAQQKSFWRRFNKPLASLRLAVVIIILIGIITAAGTIIESRYQDATAAKKLVYDTPWMYGVMILLVINLVAVMVDRWPWKRRHASFVFAHVGIIILLFGAVLTMKFGLDGSMRVGIGESNNFVQTAETDLVVYTSFDGDRYSKTFESEVDFFRHRPSTEKPFAVPAFNGEIKVIEFVPYAMASRKVVAAEIGKAGAGLRFQVQNANVNVIEWLVQKKQGGLQTHDFGPAQIHMGTIPAKGQGKNEIYLSPGAEGLDYAVFHKDSEKPFKKGYVKEGDMFEPGWMGIQFRVLRYLPAALEDWELEVKERATPLTVAAVKIIFEGKEHWVLLNDMVKLFTDNAVYLFSYTNRRIDLGFPLKLASFQVDRYEGTTQAKEYMSEVTVPDMPLTKISMNEPMKYKGLTFYQASFQEEKGVPVASVFSVNHDPGRFWKYLGSLIMTIGIVLLFYFKHLDFKLLKKSEDKKSE